MTPHSIAISDNIAQRIYYNGENFNPSDPELEPLKKIITDEYKEFDLTNVNVVGVPTESATWSSNIYQVVVCAANVDLKPWLNWYKGTSRENIFRIRVYFEIPNRRMVWNILSGFVGRLAS